jgi:hypothetical protein
MSRHTTCPTPLLGQLPGCVSLAMVHGLLRSLTRPAPDGPAEYGRQTIRDALGMVGAYAPRDALEAALVIQIVVFHYRAQQAMALAALHEDDVAKPLRCERHAMALQRGAALL